MSKKSLLTAVAAAVTLSLPVGCSDDSTSVQTTGNDTSTTEQSVSVEREKCVPVINGKNIVAANKADCATSKHSCAGQNPENEADAWVFVPKGLCDKIKSGDYSEVPDDIKEKLDV